MRKTIHVILLMFMTVPVLYAQQVISSSGTSATIPGYQLSWTVGEPVISTLTGTSAILTQGFHQTKLVVTSLDELPLSGLKFFVYPNPAGEFLNIQTEGNTTMKPTYSMYDALGKMVFSGKLENSSQTVGMENYTSGIFILKITSNKGELIQSFKILKQ